MTIWNACGLPPAAGNSFLKVPIVMMQAPSRSAPNFLTPEFNPFLFAMVGTDRLGGQLSVISALARLDLDAWAEAAALARLPRDAAVVKLSGILRKYSEIPQMAEGANVAAARLVALLPGRTSSPAVTAPASRLPAGNVVLALALFAGLCMAIGLQFASGVPHAHTAAAHVTAAQYAADPVPAPHQP